MGAKVTGDCRLVTGHWRLPTSFSTLPTNSAVLVADCSTVRRVFSHAGPPTAHPYQLPPDT